MKNVCFVIYSTRDDLPLAVFDTRAECAEFLEVGVTTLWKMEKHHHIVRGMYLEKVIL